MVKRSKRMVVTVLLSLLLLLRSVFPVSASTWNLKGDTNVHAPAYIVEKGTGTHWVFSTGSGLQVLYSTDGTTYNRSLPIFATKPAWWSSYVPNQSGLDVWAPDIFYYNGTYYLILCDLHVRLESVRHRPGDDELHLRRQMDGSGDGHLLE